MKAFSKSMSLMLDRAVIAKESGKWYGRLFKRIVEWWIFG